jgi:tRNA modification GTPase
MSDTICAISTSLGVGAISIVRLSGKDAISIANKLFEGKDLEKAKTHTIHYGYIVYNKEKIDEVLVSVMKGPKTFTREDIVEINCHGGIATTNKVLELLLLNGARMAEPGEFTKRAFLNGRINLMEAEAVMDLINGKTEEARKIAIQELNGKGSKLISLLREDLVKIISNIEVNIDYPEYNDIYEVTIKDIKEKIDYFNEKLSTIVSEYENGKILKEGINTVIVGRPNVGKSSILNKLLNDNKAIVTDIPGTTRDIVEGSISFGGIQLNIIDTAGIRETSDVVEKIGVEKSLSKIDEADLVLIILNNNEELTKEVKELLKELKNKNYIIIVNKTDLETKLDLSRIDINKDNIINMSIINNKGIDELKEKISELFNISDITSTDPTYLNNARSISILNKCLNKVEEVEEAVKNNMPIDMIELDIKSIWEELGTINGSTYEEELLDEMFKRFCLGK